MSVNFTIEKNIESNAASESTDGNCCWRILGFIAALFFFQISGSLYATIYTVSTTADGGPGSLRQAIINANADVNFPHTINFSLAAGSTITLSSNALPSINTTMVIDATTTSSYVTNGVGINLTTAGSINAGLQINNASNVEIYGFHIYGFSNGIIVSGISLGFIIGAPNKRNFINRYYLGNLSVVVPNKNLSISPTSKKNHSLNENKDKC